MNILIYAELSEGGIADYAHDQANALADRGHDVTLLCTPRFVAGRACHYSARPVLNEMRVGKIVGGRAMRRIRLALGLLRNQRTLQRAAAAAPTDTRVLTHFSEYLAPFWAPGLGRLRKRGTRFFSVLHDPVRDYVVGPRWWHARSVRDAFGFLEAVFVHNYDKVPVPDAVRVVYVPYGIHPFPAPIRPRDEVRAELGIPADAILLTSFGYIRDNKNLDLIIRAIAEIPQAYLLVAGSEQAGGNKPVAHYRALAEELGCADRCRWITRFVSAQESADLFGATELSLLVYSRSFVSSSAALSVTANYRVSSLVSSGSSTTEAIVRRYGIGAWVEPDSADAIRAGIEQWQRGDIVPDWEGYARDNSWTRNAELVEGAMTAKGLATGEV